jgi:hypothetical protein
MNHELTCKVCGKLLMDPDSFIRRIGPVCVGRLSRYFGVSVKDLKDLDKVDEKQLAIYVAQFKDVVSDREIFATEAEALAAYPDGIVKIGEVWDALKAVGIPPTRMVKAIGSDLGYDPILNEHWVCFIVGRRNRYLSRKCMDNFADLKK